MKFFISKAFLINLGIAIAILAVASIATYKGIDLYTNHGESVIVPDLTELTVDETEQLLSKQNLRCKVYDSSYVVGMPAYTVISQTPPPFSKVKENRRIYLTINSSVPPKVLVPDLRDVSLDQAKLILDSRGLLLGTLKYKPGLGRNTVLVYLQDDKPLKAGESVYKGSNIDLLLANGYGSSEVKVPDLIGLTMNEAEFVLQGSFLNVGGIDFDNTVDIEGEEKDLAQIYRQIPKPGVENKVNYGEAIDIFLSMDTTKILRDTLIFEETGEIE